MHLRCDQEMTLYLTDSSISKIHEHFSDIPCAACAYNYMIHNSFCFLVGLASGRVYWLSRM